MTAMDTTGILAIKNRRTLVRAFSVVYEVFAEYSRRGKLLLVPPVGKTARRTDMRPHMWRLVMLVRCGVMDEADVHTRKPLSWFIDGRPARSKARQKNKGTILTNRRQLARKPAKERGRKA